MFASEDAVVTTAPRGLFGLKVVAPPPHPGNIDLRRRDGQRRFDTCCPVVGRCEAQQSIGPETPLSPNPDGRTPKSPTIREGGEVFGNVALADAGVAL